MTDKTKTGNELIADFMGLESREETAVLQKRYKWIDGFFYPVAHLAYSKSWDWLMPVVEKIDKMGGSFILRQNRTILGHIDELHPGYSMLDVTHLAVVNWIKVYNSQTKGE